MPVLKGQLNGTTYVYIACCVLTNKRLAVLRPYYCVFVYIVTGTQCHYTLDKKINLICSVILLVIGYINNLINTVIQFIPMLVFSIFKLVLN